MSVKDALNQLQDAADEIVDRREDFAEMLDKVTPLLDRTKSMIEKIRRGESVDVRVELTGFPDVDATLGDALEVEKMLESAGPSAAQIFGFTLEALRIASGIAAIIA